MPKLHELLAVEGQLKGQAEATRTELGATFDKKRHLFEEKVITFTPTVEGVNAERVQEKTIQTTVHKELEWITELWAKQLDVSVQVQATCTSAKADVVLDDGTVILRDLPVLALLELEKRAGEVQQLVEKIPTLDPAKMFRPDPSRGDGYYAAAETTKTRTRKDQRPLVLYPATPEHPAQTQLITQDVIVGTLVDREWSSMITPAEKADMMTRVEELRRAIKKARMRANDQEVPKTATVGATLLRYVFRGAKPATE